MLGQGNRPFRLGPVGLMPARAVLALAAAHLQPQPHRPRERLQPAAVLVTHPHEPPTPPGLRALREQHALSFRPSPRRPPPPPPPPPRGTPPPDTPGDRQPCPAQVFF